MSELMETHSDNHPIDTRPVAAFLLDRVSGDNWFAEWRNWHYEERWAEQKSDDEPELTTPDISDNIA